MVRLILDDEDPATLPREELVARIVERDRQLRAKARSVWDLDVTDYRRAARAVFGSAALELAPPDPA